MFKRQIIAMGGGGFSEEPDNPLLDRYIFQQTGKNHPKVCFIPTASGDADGYIEKFYNSFKGWSVTLSHLSLFRCIKIDLEKFILEQDVLMVLPCITRMSNWCKSLHPPRKSELLMLLLRMDRRLKRNWSPVFSVCNFTQYFPPII